MQFLTESLFSATFSFWWLSAFHDLWPHHSSLCLHSHSDSPSFSCLLLFCPPQIALCLFLFLKVFFFFNVDHFLKKSVLDLLHYCFYFIFLVFDHEVYGILAPQWRIKPILCIGRWRLNHWTTGEVIAFFLRRLLCLDLELNQECRMISTSPSYYILKYPFSIFLYCPNWVLLLSFFFNHFFFKFEDNCFTMLYWFLLHCEVNQLYVYIYTSPLSLEPASHLPSPPL